MSMVQNLEAKLLKYVRGKGRQATALSELIEVLSSYPAAQVRLTAGDLRKRGILGAHVEGKDVVYTAIARRPREDDATPVPAPAPAPAPAPEPVPEEAAPADAAVHGRTREKLLAAFAALGPGSYGYHEVITRAGINGSGGRKYLQELVNDGKVFAQGATVSRRYSLTPFTDVEAPAAEPLLGDTPDPVEPEPMPAPTNGAHTRFYYTSDGNLGIDCERCSGELTREDLRAMSAFVNQIPRLANG